MTSNDLANQLKELSGWEFDQVQGYSLGYLLRKLPRYEITSNGLTVWATYESDDNLIPDTESWGNTPEDAICKLCIELIKQGVIKL